MANSSAHVPRPSAGTCSKISLIGYRGCGKTSVARTLALRLGWDWVDADVEVELAAGKSIAALFADEGETTFRDWESRVLERLAERRRLVLAAGGGAVLREPNRRWLQSGAKVIWLTAQPATLWKRISSDPTTSGRRPDLTPWGAEQEISRLLAERTELYRQTSDFEVDTEGREPAEIAAEILTLVELTDQAGGRA